LADRLADQPPSRNDIMPCTLPPATPSPSSAIFKTLKPLVLLALIFPALVGCGANRMSQLVGQDVRILRSFTSAGEIDPVQFRDAKAVAVLGGGEGAIVFGASSAQGTLVRRLPAGWSAPLAVDLFSGTVGLQIGGQSREFVLLFMTEAAIDRFTQEGNAPLARASGTAFDASGAASAGTPPDIISLTRAGGLFGSLAVGGLGVRINDSLNRETYGPVFTAQKVLGGQLPPPPGTLVLWSMLDEIDSMAPARGPASSPSAATMPPPTW